jgi:hypothetical protein
VPPAFHQAFSPQIFANLKSSFPNQRKSQKHGEQQQQASCRRRGGRESRQRASEAIIVDFFLRFVFDPFVAFEDHLCFRLIQWNPPSALASQPLPDDSSESDHYSPVPYGELDALCFKAELEVAQRELEDVSKKAGIAELEWEDQRKQLLATIDGTALEPLPNPIWLLILITFILHFAARDAELN